MILLFFMVCPLAVFATISLTKSPLFAFAFVWWFGVWYELHMTHIKALPTINGKPTRLRKRSIMAFTISSCVMLVSAKYAWYIILFALILALINDRKRWKTYLVTLLLPIILIHGGIIFLTNTGAIIGGDPIESRVSNCSRSRASPNTIKKAFRRTRRKSSTPSSTSTKWPKHTPSRTPTR